MLILLYFLQLSLKRKNIAHHENAALLQLPWISLLALFC